MKKIHSKLFLFVFLILSFWSCQEEEPEETPRIHLTPTSITFEDIDAEIAYVYTIPKGSANWVVGVIPEWLSAEPMSGNVGANEFIPLKLRTNPDVLEDMEPGRYSERVILFSGNSEFGNASTNVVLELSSFDGPSINVDNLYFFPEQTNKSFSIVNSGNDTLDLNWSLANYPEWISFEPSSGIIAGTENQGIVVTVNRNGLEPGQYEGQVEIVSGYEEPFEITNEHIVLDLRLDVP